MWRNPHYSGISTKYAHLIPRKQASMVILKLIVVNFTEWVWGK